MSITRDYWRICIFILNVSLFWPEFLTFKQFFSSELKGKTKSHLPLLIKLK